MEFSFRLFQRHFFSIGVTRRRRSGRDSHRLRGERVVSPGGASRPAIDAAPSAGNGGPGRMPKCPDHRLPGGDRAARPFAFDSHYLGPGGTTGGPAGTKTGRPNPPRAGPRERSPNPPFFHGLPPSQTEQGPRRPAEVPISPRGPQPDWQPNTFFSNLTASASLRPSLPSFRPRSNSWDRPTDKLTSVADCQHSHGQSRRMSPL
jgi:hypothetical protein